MEHSGEDDGPDPQDLAQRLENTGLASETPSTTSMTSDVTVITPDNLQVTPQVIAEALVLYQQHQKGNKRQRSESGNNEQNSSKKQRPNLAPTADALYKKARNSLGKVAKHEAMAQGLRRYGGFGEHIVPQIMKVSKHLFLSHLHLSTLHKCPCFSPPILTCSLYLCLPTQVKNSIPNGMGDDKLCQDWKNIKTTCEKHLLKSQLAYAERVASENKAVYDTAIQNLSRELNDQETLTSCLAATRTCAEVHRTREQQKQMKMWTEALSNYESEGAVRKLRKKKQPRRQNRRDNNDDAPQPGPSNGRYPRQNNGRTFRRAQRRLPASYQNNRGRQQGNNNNNY